MVAIGKLFQKTDHFYLGRSLSQRYIKTTCSKNMSRGRTLQLPVQAVLIVSSFFHGEHLFAKYCHT